MITSLTAAFLCVGLAVDDPVVAAVDVLVAAPPDPFPFGQTFAAPGIELGDREDIGVGRAIVEVGDVNGSGFSDVAVGFDGKSGQRNVVVFEGGTGDTLWSASPGGGRVRWFTSLDAADGVLAVAATSAGGAVELRDATNGGLLWSRDLVTPDEDDHAAVYTVRLVDDLSGDGITDVLAAGGHRVDGVTLLSGADGATLWFTSMGEEAIDARLADDVDNDGVRDIATVGGDASPFVATLSGADGSELWRAPLDGPGSVVLPTGDIDDDGITDLIVGEYDDFFPCLNGISGADGTRVWEAPELFRAVTTLDTFADVDGDGIDEIVTGSFDNAVNGTLAKSGAFQFRRELSTYNTGAALSVAAGGDVDGNGSEECYVACVDNYVYAVDTGISARMWIANTRHKQVAITSMADGTGDGRREIASVGKNSLTLYDGSSGLATGPQIQIFHEGFTKETEVLIFSYATSTLGFFGALGIGPDLELPAYNKPFQLDLASAQLILLYLGPPAGGQGFLLPPFPRELIGTEVFIQVSSLYSPGFGLMSEVASFTVSE